ncbi:MAG: hypothetical protein KKA31_01210, partial [Candidatus Margulisbacteria bacterium]|nr:hypothetical protein [Candidatus Margulisiibacteriota bacterium]
MQNKKFLFFLALIAVIVVAGIVFINKVAPSSDDREVPGTRLTGNSQEAQGQAPITVAKKYSPPTA